MGSAGARNLLRASTPVSSWQHRPWGDTNGSEQHVDPRSLHSSRGWDTVNLTLLTHEMGSASSHFHLPPHRGTGQAQRSLGMRRGCVSCLAPGGSEVQGCPAHSSALWCLSLFSRVQPRASWVSPRASSSSVASFSLPPSSLPLCKTNTHTNKNKTKQNTHLSLA